MIWIILVVITVILLYPLKVRIIHDEEYNDIDLYLVKRWDIKFDIDEFINKIYENKKKSSKISTIVNLYKIYYSTNIFRKITKFIKIKKITIVLYNGVKDEEVNMLFTVIGWLLISKIRELLYSNFMKVKDEYYMVNGYSSRKTMIKVEALAEVSLFFILLCLIVNIKNISKVKQILKRK